MQIRSEAGVVVDWLVKVVVGIALAGVILFDAGSTLVNFFTLDSSADEVALAVSTEVDAGDVRSWTDEEVLRVAKAVVASESDGVEGARVVPEGTGIDEEGVVHVRLRRTADTLVVSRIGAIAHWARATADGRSGTT